MTNPMKLTPEQIEWIKQAAKNLLPKGEVDEHFYRQLKGYHNPEPHYIGEYSAEKTDSFPPGYFAKKLNPVQAYRKDKEILERLFTPESLETVINEVNARMNAQIAPNNYGRGYVLPPLPGQSRNAWSDYVQQLNKLTPEERQRLINGNWPGLPEPLEQWEQAAVNLPRKNGKRSLLEELLEERDESMSQVNARFSSRRTKTMGQGFGEYRKSIEPGEKTVVPVVWKGDKFPVEVEVMNEHLNILVARHGVDLPKPVQHRFADYLDDLAGSLHYANVNHGPEAVTDILNGQIQGPAKWSNNTTAVVCAVIRDHIEAVHQREEEQRSTITGLLRVDDVSEAVLAAKKDARNGIAPSPKLVDADAVMHFICGPCAEDRFPHIDTGKMYSNRDLCCYCDKLTKVGVIADDRSDRPRCTHVGDLAKLAISVQAASYVPFPATDAYSPAGVLQKLHRGSGRNVHEIVDIDDKPMMELLGTALNGDQQLAGSVLRAAVLAEDPDQFSTLSSQAVSRFNNHRHVICLGCWEIGQPADYAPTRDSECNSYGRCCYCGSVTKCDITDMDLPDNPKFCRVENDTSPYQYHGVCKSCLPIVTGHHKHRAVPIFDPDYELDHCCICDKEQKTMVYAITPKKGFNPYTNTNKTTLCDDEHFTPITDKRRVKHRPAVKKWSSR